MAYKKLSYSTTKGLNYKHRILALFQFFSAVGFVFALMGYFLISEKETPQNFNDWVSTIVSALVFSGGITQSIGIFGSTLIYLAISFWLISIIFGCLMFRFKNRNLFDQLFLIFLLIPVFSNAFALFSQLATKKIEYTSSHFDKEAIIQEQTMIIKKALKEAKKEEQERLKNSGNKNKYSPKVKTNNKNTNKKK